jgi:hypothetical protein
VAAPHAELVEDVVHMRLNRRLAQEEHLGYLAVRQAFADKFADLSFSRRQFVRWI